MIHEAQNITAHPLKRLESHVLIQAGALGILSLRDPACITGPDQAMLFRPFLDRLTRKRLDQAGPTRPLCRDPAFGSGPACLLRIREFLTFVSLAIAAPPQRPS